MKLRNLILVSLILSGCNQGSSSTSSVFKVWQSQSTGALLDFKNQSVGSNQMAFMVREDGATCAGLADFDGDVGSGTVTRHGTAYAGGGGADPGCASLDGASSYSVSSNALRLCVGATCEVYSCLKTSESNCD